MTGATKRISVFVMRTRIIVPGGAMRCDRLKGKFSTETMLIERSEGPAIWEGKGLVPIFWAFEGAIAIFLY